jgi:hypothetical protein
MEEFTVDALGEWESEGGATAQSRNHLRKPTH